MVAFDDIELDGMTIRELDEKAQDVDACLTTDPSDASCLPDAHIVARMVPKLVDRDRLVDKYLEVLDRNLDVVKTAIERIRELRS